MNCWKCSFVFVVMAVALFCGCETSNVSVTDGLTTIDQNAIESRPVELPGSYDVDDFRRLRLGVAYGTIDSNTGAFKTKESQDLMNLRFQSEMAKHRRFTIMAQHGADTRIWDALSDAGEMAPSENEDTPRFRRPKILLSWKINIQEKKEAKGMYGQKLLFYCTVNATASYYEDVLSKDKSKVKYAKGDVAFTRDFDLPVIVKEQTLNSMGGVKSGFSYKSDADVQALMQEITIASAKRIAEDIGRSFPVGGVVVGALGDELFTIDRGSRQGIEKDMQMVIFARYDGVDVPLANAVASPAQDKCQLRVWRFAKDKYASMILKEINGHPKKWMQDTGNLLFAVRAVPPQDKNAGTRFE